MKSAAPATVRRLAHHQVVRLGAPVELQARAGTLWITIDGDPEDVVLEAGEARRFEAKASLIVYALGGDAEVQVRRLAPISRPGSFARLTHWLGLALPTPAVGVRP